MYCKYCGAEIPDDSKFCPECGKNFSKGKAIKTEKNMILALVISFILTGLGIAYAGNLKKGIGIFAVSLILNILGFGLPVLSVIAILLWAFAMYLTYVEVRKANGEENPDIMEDFKTLTTGKQVAVVIVALIILLIVIGGIIGAFMPHESSSSYSDDDYSTDLGSSVSSDSYSSSSGDSYSSSSNGHDVESHYEGDYGSSDTHGTVYDDGSVESHQTGHTDYGDYQIDSYMDSNGNLHGTVDVGGQTYHVSS